MNVKTWNITVWADGDITATPTTPVSPGDYVGWGTGTVYADGACDKTYYGFVGTAADVRSKFGAHIL